MAHLRHLKRSDAFVLRTLHRFALHARQTPQPFHFLHINDFDGRDRAGRRGLDYRAIGDEWLSARNPHADFERPSHLQISGPDDRVDDWQSLAKQARENPQVLAAAPYVNGQAMLSYDGTVRGALIRGIDPPLEETVADFSKHMVSGRLEDLQPGGETFSSRMSPRSGPRRRGHGRRGTR